MRDDEKQRSRSETTNVKKIIIKIISHQKTATPAMTSTTMPCECVRDWPLVSFVMCVFLFASSFYFINVFQRGISRQIGIGPFFIGSAQIL